MKSNDEERQAATFREAVEKRVHARAVAARRKLLSILSRGQLEDLSTLESPHHAERQGLIDNIASNWDEEGVREAITLLMRAAQVGE